MSLLNIEDQIEKDLAIAEHRVNLAKSLQRLMTSSSDFKSVIIEGFLRTHALHLVSEVTKSDNPEAVQREIEAISYFQKYLSTLIEDGKTALKEVEGFNSELESIRMNSDF